MPEISSVNMGQIIPYTSNNEPLFSPFGSIILSSSGDPVTATLTMDGNGEVVSGPGLSVVTTPEPPLTVTKASYTTPALSASVLQADLRQVAVAPLDPNGGDNLKYGYQNNITMYLTVTDVVTNQAVTITISDTEDPAPNTPHLAVASGQTGNISLGADNSGAQVDGNVTNNGTMNGAFIGAGGVLGNAGVLYDTTVGDGGLLTEQWNALDYNTIIFAKGSEEIYNGSSTGGSHNASIYGVQQLNGAYTYNPTVYSGGQLLLSGGNIIETYYNAGQSYDAVIDKGGTEVVSGTVGGEAGYWGVANSTVVASGGTLSIHAGGEAINADIYSGGVMNNDSFSMGAAVNGTLNDNAGGTATNTSLGGGGVMDVWSGGVAQATNLYSAGEELVQGGGNSTGTTIGSGGFEGVWGDSTGNIIYAGGKMAVYNGGVDNGSWIGSGGIEFIRSGGTEAGTVTFGGSGGEFGLQTAASGFWSAHMLGFGAGDEIDFADIGFGKATQDMFSGGVLYMADGAQHAALQFGGSYTTHNFAMSNDGAGGTMVKFAA
jgi:fibronectin-binding autotransporter adhesin